MSTNAELIGDALREINVIAETDTASAEQGAYGLRKLNELMEMWTENGINLGYFQQDSTTDECPLPEYSKMGVISALAISLAPNYGVTVSPELIAKAKLGYQPITRNAAKDVIQPADMCHLPFGSGRLNRWGWGWDINRG